MCRETQTPGQHTFLLDAIPPYWCPREIAGHGVSDKLLDQLSVCRLCLISVFHFFSILGFFVIDIAVWFVAALALSWSLFLVCVLCDLETALVCQSLQTRRQGYNSLGVTF